MILITAHNQHNTRNIRCPESWATITINESNNFSPLIPRLSSPTRAPQAPVSVLAGPAAPHWESFLTGNSGSSGKGMFGLEKYNRGRHLESCTSPSRRLVMLTIFSLTKHTQVTTSLNSTFSWVSILPRYPYNSTIAKSERLITPYYPLHKCILTRST